MDTSATGTFFKDYRNMMDEGVVLHKSASNPFFKSKYCPLPDVLEIVKPLATKHNFIIVQFPHIDGLHTKLIHASGVEIEGVIPLTQTDAQKKGGEITYFRRYSLTAMLGLGESDDDANIATGKTTQAKSAKEVKEAEHETWTPEPEITEKILLDKNQFSMLKMAREKAKMTTADAREFMQTAFGKSTYDELYQHEGMELMAYFERVAEDLLKAEATRMQVTPF
jgi:hypothetical protein